MTMDLYMDVVNLNGVDYKANKNYILRGRIMEFDASELKGVTIKGGDILQPPKPKSILWIGGKYYRTSLPADQRFNWFQKLMWKWCFGIKVEDCNEE